MSTVSAETLEAPERRSPLSVLRRRNFAIYWVGQAISLTGTWMQVLATNWVIVGFTTSAMALGLLNFSSSLPMMLLTLMGGVAADRFDKRRILVVTQVVLMLLAFALAALYLTGHLRLWHLYALAVLGGIAGAYDMPANQALTPELVEREEIPQAIALNQSIFHGSRILGPALAGVVIGALGTGSAFIANGFSFLAVIASLLLIRYTPHAGDRPTGSSLAAMGEGLQYVRRRPRLMVFMLMTMLTTFLVFPNHAVLMPLYAKKVLGVGARELGWLMGASGLGALTGSLLLLVVKREARILRIALGMGGIASALVLLGSSHSLWLSLGAVFLNSIGLSSSMGLIATITQEVVPNQLRGRVMSLNGLMFVGILPFAALIVTGVADLITLRHELLLSGTLYALGAIVLLRVYSSSPELEPAPAPAR